MIFSQAENLVQGAYRAAVADANRFRKQKAAKKLDQYHGFQADYIMDALRQHFTKPEVFTPCFINLTRKIINQLAMVYVQDARRTIDGTEQDVAIFAEIERSCSLGARMKLANRYAKLLGMVAVRPVWRNNALDLDVVTPDLLDVQTGDSPEEIQAILVTYYPEDGKETEVTYSLWTPDTFQRLDYRGLVLEEASNPYKIIPYIYVWNSLPTITFWTPSGEDLMALQDAFNEKLTDLLYVLRMQGFGVGYVKGMKGEIGQVDPGTFFNLPTDGEMGFAKTNAPVQDTLAALDFILKQAAVSNGLPAGSLQADVSDQSGVAVIAGNRELEEMRADDLELYRRYEARLFDLIRITWNAHNPGRKISDSATLQVDFYDVQPSLSQDKQVQVWDALVALGVMSKVDVLQKLNPDLSKDDAMARLIEIADENKAATAQQI